MKIIIHIFISWNSRKFCWSGIHITVPELKIETVVNVLGSLLGILYDFISIYITVHCSISLVHLDNPVNTLTSVSLSVVILVLAM
jgi:hypothetical protein